jgi:WG containing repeat
VHAFSEGMAAVKVATTVGDKYGFIDKRGRTIIEPQFDEVLPFSDGFARFRDGTSYGFIGKDGVALAGRFSWAGSFSEGMAAVTPLKSPSVSGKFGFINAKGEVVIDFRFDSAEPFSEGLAAACVDKTCGHINREGLWAIEPRFDHTGSFSGGLAVIAAKDGILLNSFGYIDRQGRVTVPQRFSNARSFSEGLAAVAVNGRYGYIDKTGKLVIPLQYSDAYDFSEGVASVLVDSSGEYFKKFAFIDKFGKRLSKQTYSYAGTFRNGIAQIRKRNFFAKLDVPMGKLAVCAMHYIDRTEKSIWKETNWGCK